MRRLLMTLVGLYLLLAAGKWAVEALGVGGLVSAADAKVRAGVNSQAWPYSVGLLRAR
jgi:hypothetical protein